jgi:hypothetical protein
LQAVERTLTNSFDGDDCKVEGIDEGQLEDELLDQSTKSNVEEKDHDDDH